MERKKENKGIKRVLVIAIVATLIVASFAGYMWYDSVQTKTFEAKRNGFETKFTIHLLVQQFRNGILISESYHAMTVVDNGKDWVEQQLFNPNASQKALYLSTSASVAVVDTAWTKIDAEITTNGLGRALGAYVSTGVGAANVTYTYTVTGTQSTQMYGINYDSYASYPESLIAAEQQGAGAVKNLLAGDTLALTAMWAHA